METVCCACGAFFPRHRRVPIARCYPSDTCRTRCAISSLQILRVVICDGLLLFAPGKLSCSEDGTNSGTQMCKEHDLAKQPREVVSQLSSFVLAFLTLINSVFLPFTFFSYYMVSFLSSCRKDTEELCSYKHTCLSLTTSSTLQGDTFSRYIFVDFSSSVGHRIIATASTASMACLLLSEDLFYWTGRSLFEILC